MRSMSSIGAGIINEDNELTSPMVKKESPSPLLFLLPASELEPPLMSPLALILRSCFCAPRSTPSKRLRNTAS